MSNVQTPTFDLVGAPSARRILALVVGAGLALTAGRSAAAPGPSPGSYEAAARSFREAMLHETKWSLPRPGDSACEFSQDTSSFAWNGKAEFRMDLSASTTSVKALGSSSVKITCGGGMACVSNVGTTKKTRARTIPVSPGKASQAAASIAKLRRLVPACR